MLWCYWWKIWLDPATEFSVEPLKKGSSKGALVGLGFSVQPNEQSNQKQIWPIACCLELLQHCEQVIDFGDLGNQSLSFGR